MTHAEQLAKIYWDNSKNFSRQATGLFKDQKDEHRLTALLVRGWDDGLGRPKVTLMNQDEVKSAVEDLKARHTALQEADLTEDPAEIRVGDEKIRISKSEILRAFETVHCDKNGKIIPPKFRGVTCYRRANVLLKANTVRLKQGKGVITELPVAVEDYAENAVGEVEDNLIENLQKTEGSRGVCEADLMSGCRTMFNLGASESKFQARVFHGKRGMAQKIHRIMKLDQDYPTLKVVDRIVSGKLSSKPLDKEKVKALLDKKATEEEVKAFLAKPNGGNKDKIMPRKEIEALSEQSPVKIIKLVAQAIMKNDPGLLAKVTANAAAINDAVKAFVS